MDDATKKRIEDLEEAYFEITKRYQHEVGEPRRLLLQSKELMTQFDWQAIKEPPELRQLLAAINQAAGRF